VERKQALAALWNEVLLARSRVELTRKTCEEREGLVERGE